MIYLVYIHHHELAAQLTGPYLHTSYEQAKVHFVFIAL
jgi:hypothetical protein